MTAIFWIDVINVLMIAFSFIRQFLSLFPEGFGMIGNLLTNYINLNLMYLLAFSLYITFAVAIMLKLILSYYLFGIDSSQYSMINTMIVFIDGFSIQQTEVYTIPETFETVQM